MPRFPRPLLAAAMLALCAAPAFAQEGKLTGTITEIFGRQVVVTTGSGRILVTLPDGAPAATPGLRVDMTGTRAGETFAATAMTALPAATASEDARLPAILRDLGLTQLRIRSDGEGKTYLYGKLPDGQWLRAKTRADQLVEIHSDGAGVPRSVVEAMLPEAARKEPRLAEMVRVSEIDVDDTEISVEGFATDGARIEIEFSRSGQVREFERKQDSRRSLSDAAARERLTSLGYSELGYVQRGGRHVEVLARNPYGEWIEVRLNEQGQVEREKMWLSR